MKTPDAPWGGDNGNSVDRSNRPVDIRAVRSRLVDRGLCLFAILAFPALIFSVARILEHGWHPIFLFHMGSCAAMLGACVFRRRVSYALRASFLLGVLLILGTVGLLVYGLAAGGFITLVTFAALTTVVLGTRAGLTAVGVSLCIVVAVAMAVCMGGISFSFDVGECHGRLIRPCRSAQQGRTSRIPRHPANLFLT